MLVSLWSLKGGVGCSVTAALVALNLAHAHDGSGCTLLDLGDDLPAVLGCAAPAAGVADWLAAGTEGPPNGLAKLAVNAAPGLELIGRGRGQLPHVEPPDVLARQLDLYPGPVVADAGLVLGSSPRADLARWFATHSTRSVLVTTACYLALVKGSQSPVVPTGVVLVREQGRALDTRSVEDAIGAPVIAEIDRDLSVARAVDAGLLSARVPRGMHRVLGAVA